MEETYEYYRAKMMKKNEWSEKDEKYYKMEPDKKISFKRIEPLLKIDLKHRRDMDIGSMEETYEYYRAKMMKKNEWSEEDEKYYKMEPDKKIPFKRIEPLLKIDLKHRRDMDIGSMEETYEYYRAKKIKKNEEFLNEKEWKKLGKDMDPMQCPAVPLDEYELYKKKRHTVREK